jgi:hypothetical protein
MSGQPFPTGDSQQDHEQDKGEETPDAPPTLEELRKRAQELGVAIGQHVNLLHRRST